MKKIDYSSEAITRRLKQTDQLRVLSLSLIKAKKEYDEKLDSAEKADESKPKNKKNRVCKSSDQRGSK